MPSCTCADLLYFTYSGFQMIVIEQSSVWAYAVKEQNTCEEKKVKRVGSSINEIIFYRNGVM